MPISKSTKNYTQEDVEEWGQKEVSLWLKNLKLDSFVAEFTSLQIDGQRLLVRVASSSSISCPSRCVRSAECLKFEDSPHYIPCHDGFLLYIYCNSHSCLSNAFFIVSFSSTSPCSQFTDCHASLVFWLSQPFEFLPP